MKEAIEALKGGNWGTQRRQLRHPNESIEAPKWGNWGTQRRQLRHPKEAIEALKWGNWGTQRRQLRHPKEAIEALKGGNWGTQRRQLRHSSNHPLTSDGRSVYGRGAGGSNTLRGFSCSGSRRGVPHWCPWAGLGGRASRCGAALQQTLESVETRGEACGRPGGFRVLRGGKGVGGLLGGAGGETVPDSVQAGTDLGTGDVLSIGKCDRK